MPVASRPAAGAGRWLAGDSDGTLLIFCPQSTAAPDAVAAAIAQMPRSHGKPLLASWMGGKEATAGATLLNAAGIPLVHAAILEYGGQLTTVVPGGPCYRCLFGAPPNPADVPSCAEAGILGSVAGVVGRSPPLCSC